MKRYLHALKTLKALNALKVLNALNALNVLNAPNALRNQQYRAIFIWLPKSLLLLLFIFNGSLVFAQHKLGSGRQSAFYTYVYKLSNSEAFTLAAKGKDALTDAMMHTLVDSLPADQPKQQLKSLPYGNYLYVHAAGNRLDYHVEPVQNLVFAFVNNTKDFQFSLTDLNGKLVANAEVITGKGSKARYQADSKLYVGRSSNKNQVIRASYQGVVNVFNYDLESPRPVPFFKRLFPKKNKYMDYGRRNPPKVDLYTGYMVFNKPMYKPKDSIRFKAYLVDKKGKAIYNKTLRADIYDTRGDFKGTVANLKPYREGAYEGAFVIADSLDLDLDEDYELVLREQHGDKLTDAYRGRFRYEDYELKALDFSVRTDKDVHTPGNPIKVFMRAVDENGLAVPDGRVAIKIRGLRARNLSAERVFLKTVLFEKDMNLDPVGETVFTIPYSIFPKADVDFFADIKFLNANNESHSDSKYLTYKVLDQKMLTRLSKDSLMLDYNINGKSQARKTTIIFKDRENQSVDSLSLHLPSGIPIPTRYKSLHFLLGDDQKDVELSGLDEAIQPQLQQGRDSLRIFVDNPHQVPFWYTIFSGKRVMMNGYTKRLDTIIRNGNGAAAQLTVAYQWAGVMKNRSASAGYFANALNVNLFAPVIVYPGQGVNMQVQVTNTEKIPVAGIDVTALAYTSKFKNGRDVYLPSFAKSYKLRKEAIQPAIKELVEDGMLRLNWQKWARAMHLDTIAYYQFMHPKEVYEHIEPVKDKLAEVMPFLIKDGTVEPVSIVYIDRRPVYFNQTDQLQNYVFRVDSGKHDITLRSANFAATLTGYLFQPKQKYILGVAADVANTRAQVTIQPSVLDKLEADALQRYMMRITDNFNGQKAVVSTDQQVILLNPPPDVRRGSQLLVGPLREQILRFKSGKLDQNFLNEPGYTYTFFPGLLKQKAEVNPYIFSRDLTYQKPQTDYKQQYLDKNAIDSLWNDHLDLRSRTSQLFTHRYSGDKKTTGTLSMEVDQTVFKASNYLKNILIYKEGEPDFVEIYPGNTTYFSALQAGTYSMLYLFKDNRYFVAKDVKINMDGANYFKWKQPLQAADEMSKKIDQQIKSTGFKQETYEESQALALQVAESFNEHYGIERYVFNFSMAGYVYGEDKRPLPGVRIQVKGYNRPAITDVNGHFVIAVPEKGMLLIQSIGYQSKEVKIRLGDVGNIYLEPDSSSLNEVVVIGYGVQSKRAMAESVATVLQGRAAGVSVGGLPADMIVQIRGLNSMPTGQPPLYIVDGVVVAGGISGIDPNEISNIQTLKDATATAIYGSMAANGVVIVTTKKGNTGISGDGSLIEQTGNMRTNFSDYAIWQPKLLTDAAGKASFKVTFPDDITSWTTKVIAMNGNKQSGQANINIKSFKTLSANFVSPQFAVTGDSIDVMGKLMNYSGGELKVNRRFVYNGTERLNSAVNFKNAHLDTIEIVAKGSDSLRFEYTLKQDNGYFDGEIRKVPVVPAGVQETKGYFDALLKDTTINYQFDAHLGKISLYAEASVFPVLLDEITKLRSYEYLCNEQMASKLKALLLEKKLRQYLKEEFKHEKDIQLLLKKISVSKRPEGTWGWWQDSPSSYWISRHVVSALLEAKNAGYTVNLDTKKLSTYLSDQLHFASVYDQTELLKLLMLINPDFSAKSWIETIENSTELKKRSLYQELELMALKQQSGAKVDIQGLLKRKKETMFGNVYWGEPNNSFWDNSIQNTLLAYRILNAEGGYEAVLDQITRYFLEQRKSGQWRNTYESSLILETILPKLIQNNKSYQPASLTVNGEMVTQFPYQKTLSAAQAVQLSKKGNAPVYVTAYQQFFNPKPEKVSKDFVVTSSFEQQGIPVKRLKAGQATRLKVEVEARADGDYVMIEVPIPAGCSYENKTQSYWGLESHREYFKEKTSIFCTKLKQGKHTFYIELMPRYSGVYNLNPAKAELMYFPVFYGREGMKKIGVGN
ncbi:alpha-2-macroglobulin family protein [Pedobacter duraquae]|uniref:TonB-dependent SusC/RagA subfamily outer membrane receptor n=1 Tax=Pedobacter duraquae TaxID=425511 RepID=A0A4R6ILI0_9SPHI|nr:alpha-2-macroglobulin family protein [Pedobacter duraquae]TDO22994.1 TonB-dependent SusC/RagA subfamily outer membrane receptor [Pedobacter duraquae]